MTLDSMLVTRRAPTMVELRAAVKGAGRRTEMGAAELVGDWDDDDPMVEISADVSDGELLAQLSRPSISLTTAADEYIVRIGLAPPSDDEGRCWLTAIATSARATDAQIWAVLGVLASLAVAAGGYLVTNGEHVSLESVPEPDRIAAVAPPPSHVPPDRAFVNVFCTTAVTGDGRAGWTWFMDLLRDLLAGHGTAPDLRPRYIQQDGEWRRFLPSQDPPPWWPLGQQLLTAEPYLRWELDPAFGPGDRLSQLALAGDLDPPVAESLLPDLSALAGPELAYALVHAWHDDEPVGEAGLRMRRSGPRMLVPAHTLIEALPTLYWAQILGPPWTALFGADTIAGTPAHRVEQVAPGCWLIQLTEHLSDVVEDHTAFEQARAAAIGHLGADAFFSTGGGTREHQLAASIPTLEERGVVTPS